MEQAFPRVDISEWQFRKLEQGGQGQVAWYRPPGADETPRSDWLFKPVQIHENGFRQGGDWAEKVAAEIARLLGIPVAQSDLAIRGELEGCISRNVRDQGSEFYTASLWMHSLPTCEFTLSGSTKSQRDRRASPGYTLDAVETALIDVAAPVDVESLAWMTGFEVFVGFLILDAVIANQDRHEENWGVLRAAVGTRPTVIAPAFDQEGSLGFQLRDTKRRAILNAGPDAMRVWADRGAAVRFWRSPGQKPLTLVGAAFQGLTRISPRARQHWMDRLTSVSEEALQDVFDRASTMSEPERMFASRLVTTNLSRMGRLGEGA